MPDLAGGSRRDAVNTACCGTQQLRTQQLQFAFLALQGCDEKSFHLIPRPMGFPEKFQSGFDGRVRRKAADSDAVCELIPAIFLYEAGDDDLERVAVERVFRVGIHEEVPGDQLAMISGRLSYR
jgi:hypothetical protein